jgi:replication-associated recombination protein RarA
MENWTKEYAPKTLEEYVQDDEIKETIQKYIDNDMRTPMIFEGPVGTGKTTLARIIGNEETEDDINAAAEKARLIRCIENSTEHTKLKELSNEQLNAIVDALTETMEIGKHESKK